MNDTDSLRSFGMADVSNKPITARRALARGQIQVGRNALEKIINKTLPKGDVLTMAEIAGIQGAKLTPQLLPLCHPISLNRVSLSLLTDDTDHNVRVYALAEINERTGVEMEALTAVSVALLTIWDLVKPVNAALQMEDIRLLYKSGGKQGDWVHPEGMNDLEREILANS